MTKLIHAFRMCNSGRNDSSFRTNISSSSRASGGGGGGGCK